MHYNTIFQVLAIFTLFAASTADVGPPCQVDGTTCVSSAQCCSKFKLYLIFQVVFVLMSFYDFQVTCACLVPAPQLLKFDGMFRLLQSVKNTYCVFWVRFWFFYALLKIVWIELHECTRVEVWCWNGQINSFGWNCDFAWRNFSMQCAQ